MKKNIIAPVIVFVALAVIPIVASAHVTVKPAEVGISQRMNFVVSVPTEEDHPTVGLRLLIPEGVKSVMPNVKAGWKIELKKTGEGENLRVSEIIWSGGQIPAEQRDEFVFSAQAPVEKTTLEWKAYQTYSNGHVVAWDTDPKVVEEYTKNNPPKEGEEDDHSAPKPYSQTKVIDDLASTPIPTPSTTNQAPSKSSSSSWPFIISIAALVIAIASWSRKFKHV